MSESFIDYSDDVQEYVPKKLRLIIIVTEDIVTGGDEKIAEYVKIVMDPYCDDVDSEPTIVQNYDDIFNEYTEQLDVYESFDEFCMKNYGAYFNESGVLVSTVNSNGFWEKYDIVNHMKLDSFDNFIDDNLVTIFDENKILLERSALSFGDIIDIVGRNLDKHIINIDYI